MKSLLLLITSLAAVTLASAAEPPSKFAGRWAGIAEFGHSKNSDLNDERALLIFEVTPQGTVTNGTIRDFAGQGLARFGAPVGTDGWLRCTTLPFAGTNFGQLDLKLGRTSGTGTYRDVIAETWKYRSTIRLWREQKPPTGAGQAVEIYYGPFAAIEPENRVVVVLTNRVIPPLPPTPVNPNGPVCTNDVITEIPPRPDRTNIIRLPPLPPTPLNPEPNL